jgi:general secretion pathway protein G
MQEGLLDYAQGWLSYVLRPLGLEGLFGTSRFLTGSQRGLPRKKGFTVIELILTTTLIGILAAIVTPRYHDVVVRGRIAQATGDVNSLAIDLNNYRLQEGKLPLTLAEIGRDHLLDPWGFPYEYLPIRGYPENLNLVRKNRFLKPINSDFDLCSIGADGATSKVLTQPVSLDDVIRGADGGFVGLAEYF